MKTGKYTEGQVATLGRRAYLEGEAGFEISAEKSALLVIDMQEEIVRPHWSPFWVPEATRLTARIKVLIERCRQSAVPVIFTALSTLHNGLDRPGVDELMPGRFTDLNLDHSEFFNQELICEDLAPEEGELIIRKPTYGAFLNTPLETILHNLNRDTILICGALTNFACGTTARQGYERGFKVVVGSDVTATDDPALHKADLMVLRRGFARVMTAKKIIDAL